MTRPYTNFGRVVSQRLAAQKFTQKDFSSMLGISIGYFNQTLTGVRKPNAKLADDIADSFDLSENERYELHYLAAVENGFKLR